MKRPILLWVFILVVGGVMAVSAATPATQALKHSLKVQQALQDREKARLGQVQADFLEALTRVERGSADFLHAQQQGESLESLQYRDEDLRLAESETLMLLLEMQRLRLSILTSQTLIAETQAEIDRSSYDGAGADDPLTGTWRIVMDPGNMEGTLNLVLDGTLVQGTYALDGGWTGSLRGTLVAGRLRLERIDSELGFAAIFYGALRMRGQTPRIDGKWEATQLATGLPSAGGWMAERLDEPPAQ